MIFAEQKLKTRYKYTVTDAFGTITISSPKRLVVEDNTEYLDDVFMAIYEQHKNESAGKITGTVKDTKINYKFIKKTPWEDIKENE